MFQGGDTDAMRSMGATMRQGAMKLQERQSEILRAMSTMHWEGPDAEQFTAQVRSQVLPKLHDAQQHLVDRGNDLTRQASEQDDASDPRSMLEKINDFLHIPAELTRGIRNIQKIMTDVPKMLERFREGRAGLDTLRDLAALRKEFPALAAAEYKTIMKEWDATLNGKGWQKLGDFIPQKISKYTGINIPGKEWAGKALSHLDEITDATKPWVKVGSKSLGKLLPGLDIGLGVHQIATGDTYNKVSGGLSVASGTLVLLAPLAGPAAPLVAGVGVGLGVTSAVLDLGRAAYDNIPAVKNVADTAGKAISDGAGKVADGASKVWKGVSSLFG